MLIAAEKIFFRYESVPADDFALKDVSFALNSGECIALIGPSGSGKSTLAQLLNGLLRPDRGRLLVDGETLDYKPRSLRDLRRRIGLIFQLPEAQIFEQTVFDEVAFAARQWGFPDVEIRSRVQAALHMVGLDAPDFSSRNPLRLSGGEARLVTLASLLVVDPDWLILDEPTLGLDFQHTRCVISAIQRRREDGRGVLLITHDLDLALSQCPRAMVLNGGMLAFDGSTEVLLKNHNLKIEFGLEDPESLRIWKLLRQPVGELTMTGSEGLVSAVNELPADRRQKVVSILQQYARG